MSGSPWSSSTGASSVSMYSLDDAFGAMSYDEMRGRLLAEYATPLEVIRAEVLTDLGARSLFDGMHRFMLEDQGPLHPELSRTKLREHCKEFAYQMIRRSRAWGDLVGTKFPHSLRLSIHPQPRHAEKIGLHLIRTRDSWLTPWHGVVLDDGVNLTLVKRSQGGARARPHRRRHPRGARSTTPSASAGSSSCP